MKDWEDFTVPRKLLEVLARKYFHVATIETRNSDSLDFYDVAIWNIREALAEAYTAGFAAASGNVRNPRSTCDRPARRLPIVECVVCFEPTEPINICRTCGGAVCSGCALEGSFAHGYCANCEP